MAADLKAEEITEIIRQQLTGIGRGVDVSEVGTVVSVGDGIARVYGSNRVMAGELVQFPHDVAGLALNLEEDNVGVVLLGEAAEIKEGDEVRRTGKIMSVPVGPAPGRPRGQSARRSRSTARVRSRPPSSTRSSASRPASIDRKPVKEPLQTGLKAIDAMIPIGRGQRELIIGDRQTGKTAVAVDTIINQKGKDVICIYVAIGQKKSTVAQVVKTLEEYGAMELHHRRQRLRLRAGAAAVPRAVRRLRHGRVLPVQRAARAVHLRRSLQARRGLSRDLAAAPPPARPRGVSRRRFLSPLAPSGARLEAD